MCGRFTLRSNMRAIAQAFGLSEVPDLTPRYNVAPTQSVLAVRQDESAHREAIWLKWGLVPFWADDPSIGSRTCNARSETIDTKPAFREAFRQRRCLIVADGFYEWKKAGKDKQPFYITLKQDGPFAFAGLSEHWRRGELAVDSCTIITTEANPLVGQLHDRMPVIVPPDQYGTWLSPAASKEQLTTLLAPYPPDDMQMLPVDKRVNSPKVDTPDCIMAAAEQQRTLQFE